MPAYSYDPRLKIRDYFGRLSPPLLPSPLHLLVWTRELLDDLKDDSAFPVARLYGNWSVHTRISGSSAGYHLLGRINQELANALSPKAPKDADLTGLATNVAQALSTIELRSELRDLFEQESIPAPFLNSYLAWNQLLAGIFAEIRGKPIEFPPGDPATWKPKVRAIYDTAKAAIVGGGVPQDSVLRRFLVDVIRIPEKNEDPSRGSLHCVCEMEGGTIMTSVINAHLFEARAAFARD